MGEQSSGRCKTWVDDIYWSHFQLHHFAQFLRSDFDQHLALPKTFSDNLKKKLPEKVGLRGPGGVVWKIGLTTRDDTSYFTRGWQKFVKDNSLNENDFLVFKYNGGESLFDVLMFNGESFCEKAASYFVRQCAHAEHGGGCSSKRKDTGHSLEEGNAPSNAGVECAAPEKSVHDNGVKIPAAVPIRSPARGKNRNNAGVKSASPEPFVHANGDAVPITVPLRTTDKRIRRQGVSAANHVESNRRGRSPKLSSAPQEVVDLGTDSEPVHQNAGDLEQCTSNRRPVTENEINSALLLAQAACTDKSLLIVMRPTHVYKKFYLPIPSNWMTEHLSTQSQDLILRIGKTEWRVKYHLQRPRYTGGLTGGGWRNFVLDNNLEEFDVCVFEPMGKVNGRMILDANIFRVVEDIDQPSMVKTPGKKIGRKRAISAVYA